MRMGSAAVVLSGAALLAACPGAGAPAAGAAMAWTVRPGGPITATAARATLTDTKTGVTLACSTSRMSGTLKAGSGLAGASIGSITKAAYACSGPTGWPKLTPRGLPWQLNLTSYDARTGVSRGTVSHLQLALIAPVCHPVINGTSGATADGAVAVSYTDRTGQLKILLTGGNLHWYHADGCAHLVRNGDPAELSATYVISPPQTITSP
jgi:hypothetical protein